jgi:hypothetical protein
MSVPTMKQILSEYIKDKEKMRLLIETNKALDIMLICKDREIGVLRKIYLNGSNKIRDIK